MAIDMPLQVAGRAKGTVALAAAMVSTLLALAAFSAMRTAPSTLLALAALSAMRAGHRWAVFSVSEFSETASLPGQQANGASELEGAQITKRVV